MLKGSQRKKTPISQFRFVFITIYSFFCMCGCVCVFWGCVCFITNKIIVNNNNIHHKHVFCVLFCTTCPRRRIVTSVGSGDVVSRPPGPDSPLDYTCCHCTGFNAYHHHHHHRQIMCFFFLLLVITNHTNLCIV